MSLLEVLVDNERALTRGDGEVYRRLLADDAVVIVPGMVLDKPETAAAIDRSDGWDEVDIAEAQLRRPADDVALVTYRFTGQRGAQTYRALMSSAYAQRDGHWRLVLHQQTPLPHDAGA